MTHHLRRRTISVFAIRACAFGALLASAAGCGSDKGNPTCPLGDETCHCYGNHTCNGSLTCASDVCVDLTGGGAGSTGGAASTLAAQGGTTALGTGTTGSTELTGGALGAGGTTGLVTVTGVGGGTAGGAQGVGGGGDVGGATGSGGLSAAGGIPSNGGIANAGGAQPIGGGANSGGAQPIGGGIATGGLTSISTDPSLGGQSPLGGASSTGGAAALGGAATGGQSPTTGGAPPGSCGNGIVEPWEGCDPAVRDYDLGDGCTPLCKVEPNCPPGGGACATRCGDGFVLGEEACDDGNTANGDGCSSTCQVEAAFDCSLAPVPSAISVPLVVRDFKAGGDFELGSAFGTGLNYANQGLLQASLDANGLKPVLVSTSGTYNGVTGKASGIQSAASFAQWYSDASSGPNARNATLATELRLYRDDTGAYANRWGANGERWVRESYYADHWCGTVGNEALDADGNPMPCTMCLYDEDLSTPQCDPQPYATDCTDNPDMLRCETRSGAYYGIYVEGIFDGSPAFFPADSLTPANPAGEAELPPYYATMWTPEPAQVIHNFSFTTEARFWFKYDASQPLKLAFIGDDDVWVFIDKKLILDLGGIHTPVQGTLTVNSDGTATTSVSPTELTTGTIKTSITSLGLENGKLYEVTVFHAERQTTASTYMLSFTGLNVAPSICIRK